MERNEYAITFGVEDRHWWYVALRALLSQVWDRYLPSGPLRLLDVGCGTGANLKYLDGKADCFGIDLSVEAIQFCLQRGTNRTAVASADRRPVADNSCDAVLLCDVLYHRAVRDKSVPLREAHRALKPGCLLLVNVPAYQWLYSAHDVHVQTDRRFTRGELCALLQGSRLHVVYCTYWNALLFPAIAAIRLWRKIRPLPASDLDDPSGGKSSRLMNAIMRIERAMLRVTPMPFGLSSFAVARK